MANQLPLPVGDRIINLRNKNVPKGESDPDEGKITRSWIEWLNTLSTDVAAGPVRIGATVSVALQNASIGTTAIDVSSLNAGLYRFTYYAAVTTAAVTSSSLTVVLSWTEDSIAKSKTFTAITGNTTATTGSETYMFSIDGGSPISFATTYASNGAGEMVYRLKAGIEEYQA